MDAVGTHPAVAAHLNVQRTLLALARSMRRPRTYVGYCAFILMGLLKKCRPVAWEGKNRIDLLQTFAPWSIETCNTECAVQAISCALVARECGLAECVAISEEHPLANCSHYVAGIQVPPTAVAEYGNNFELFYAGLGVAVRPTVMDGDCAFDVMNMMLATPLSLEARTQLRIELSDYLISRINEPWMHNLMVSCQELDQEDVERSKSSDCTIVASITQVAPPLEEPQEASSDVLPDEETYKAIRWASGLLDDSNVLSLVRSLPEQIINEQLQL